MNHKQPNYRLSRRVVVCVLSLLLLGFSISVYFLFDAWQKTEVSQGPYPVGMFLDFIPALADFAQAEKCLTQYAPKHRLVNVMIYIPELKERMAQSLYEQRAKVYDAIKEKKLAAADRAKAKALNLCI